MSSGENSSSLEELRTLIVNRAVERKAEGFTLASGKISTLYVDLRRLTQDPRGISLIGKLVFDKIVELAPYAEFVGGLETGSIPIATSVCLLSAGTPRPLGAFWVRKSVKDHGLQNRIEGNISKGGKVVIVDDTITTGGSSIQAAQAVRDFGAEVVLAIGIIDRGAKENFQNAKIPYYAFFDEQDISQSK
jgi:orotate phosphoribosyltransferase